MMIFKMSCNKQQGFIVVLALVLTSLAAIAFIFNVINLSNSREARVSKTGQALVLAKQALIGTSVGSDNMPGALPCPDTNNDGTSNTCSAGTSIGRLPWKTLGLTDLRDGDGECLWYAISPIFRNTLAISTRGSSQPALNTNTLGSVQVLNEQALPVDTVIAVIIAAGSPLSGQSRTDLGSTVCGGNVTASNYLDASNSINNATGNRSGNNLKFIMGKIDNTFNDKLIYITLEDLYNPLRKRIAREMMGNFGVYKGLSSYYQNQAKYPCPATSAATGTPMSNCNTPPYTGFIPYSDAGMNYTTLGTWLMNNGWFTLTSYIYNSPSIISVAVAGVASSSTCSANLATVTCH